MKRYQWLILFMCLAYFAMGYISCVGAVKNSSANTYNDEEEDDSSINNSINGSGESYAAECVLTCEGCCDAQGNCQNPVSADACGISGGSCKTCSNGGCLDGQCQGSASCNAENCSGCCQGDVCITDVTGDACGRTGVPCLKCISGQCLDGQCTNCPPNCTDHCQNEPDGCGSRCPDSLGCSGCCTMANVCVPGLQNDACGQGGALCSDCTTNSEGKTSCSGQQCGQPCIDGCLSNNGCQPGDQPTLCGSKGQVCTNCQSQGLICQNNMCVQSDGSCDTSQTRWISAGYKDGSWCITGKSLQYCTRTNYDKEQKVQNSGSDCYWADTGNIRLRDCWGDHIFNCEAGNSCKDGTCQSDGTCDTSKTRWAKAGYHDTKICSPVNPTTRWCDRWNYAKEQRQQIQNGQCTWVWTNNTTEKPWDCWLDYLHDCPTGQTCNNGICSTATCDQTRTTSGSENGFWCTTISGISAYCTTANYTVNQKQVKDNSGNCIWQDVAGTKKYTDCWSNTVTKCSTGTLCNQQAKKCIVEDAPKDDCDQTRTTSGSENGFWCTSTGGISAYCTTANYTVNQKQVKDNSGNCIWQDVAGTKKYTDCWSNTVTKCSTGTLCNQQAKTCVSTTACDQTRTTSGSENGFWCTSTGGISAYCTTANYTVNQKQVKDNSGNCIWQDVAGTKKYTDCWSNTVTKCSTGTLCNQQAKKCI